MLHITVTLHSNFLHVITSLKQHLLRDAVRSGVNLWCYVICLYPPLCVIFKLINQIISKFDQKVIIKIFL